MNQWILVGLLTAAIANAEVPQSYNVVWKSPSAESFGSMPRGTADDVRRGTRYCLEYVGCR